MTQVVLMTQPMHPLVTDGCQQRYELLRLWEAEDPDALLAERGGDVDVVAHTGHGHVVDATMLDRVPRAGLVANFGVGYDTVDAAAATERGVLVTNGAGSLDDEVADTAMGLLLMAVRELGAAERHLRAGRWPREAYPLTRLSLRGATLGILGLGRIGSAVARRAEACGLAIAYHNRRPKDSPHRYYDDLVEMAAAVDILVVAAPGGPDTVHLVDEAVLDALGPAGVLVNVARGSLVDEGALVRALAAGRLGTAALDVYEHEPQVPEELLALDRVVLLPHVGSASVATREAMARQCLENIVGWLEWGTVLTPVPESRDLAAERLLRAASRPG